MKAWDTKAVRRTEKNIKMAKVSPFLSNDLNVNKLNSPIYKMYSILYIL